MYLRDLAAKIIALFIKNLEYIGSRWQGFASLYQHLFYKRMIEKELWLSNLKPGMKILHLGCGPVPFTSIFLAQKGYIVEAVDKDNEAIQRAKTVIGKNGLDNKIKIRQAEGSNIDCSDYDAVWVSFYVSPRRECVQQILSTIKDGGVVIYRNSRGWLTRLYQPVNSDQFDQNREVKRVKQRVGKESVIILNNCQSKGLEQKTLVQV